MSESYRNKTRNAILARDDVGKAKPSAYNLPDEGHSFGRAEIPDMEGAGEVTMNWASHMPSSKKGPDQRDFVRINKKAALSNVSSAKDLAHFSKKNDIRMRPTGPSGLLPKIIPSDVHPTFAYGTKARPSTPITQVMNGDYEAAESMRLENLYKQREEAAEARQKKHKVVMTKAAQAQISNARAAKQAKNAPEPPAPFKLSKYKNVSSKLSLAPLPKSASSPVL